MQKPNGYDEAKAGSEFTPVELGGHFAIIKQVSEKKSSTGKDMIVVLFDFIAPDKQAGYHSAAFENDDRPERKWPYNGTKYIMVNDARDPKKTNRDFKAFCTMFEKSNGCEVKWSGADWGKQFKNKRIGVVYGEEENTYDGKTFMRRVPRWFCAWDAVTSEGIPKPKYEQPRQPAAPAVTNDGFMNVPDDADDGIPF